MRPLVILTVLLALLLLANVPFYAGSTVGAHHSWRMEHGRITLERKTSQNPQGFWIAPNAEGLRWAVEVKTWDSGEWRVTLPLWIPLAVATVRIATLLARRSDEHSESPTS